MIKLETETLNKKVLSKQQKVERDEEDTMSSGKLFHTFRAATEYILVSKWLS